MQAPVTFDSDGLKLSGIVHTPEDLKTGERRPAMLVMHGFGNSKNGDTYSKTCEMFAGWGYIALRFDYRGCGDSEGERGRVICLEEVEDTRNALVYMASRSDVDPQRIGVIGHSFGAAVAAYAGGATGSASFGYSIRRMRHGRSSPTCWRREGETGKKPACPCGYPVGTSSPFPNI